MKKPNKKEIISGIQLTIMLLTMVFGFWFIYLMIWFNCGLPQEWWSILVTMVLGFLSTFGLCYWIKKEGANDD